MPKGTFEYILCKIEGDIMKETTFYREAISLRERLAVCLSATEKKMESTPSAHGHVQALPSAQNILIWSWPWPWTWVEYLPGQCGCFGRNALNNIWAWAWAWPWAWLTVRVRCGSALTVQVSGASVGEWGSASAANGQAPCPVCWAVLFQDGQEYENQLF